MFTQSDWLNLLNLYNGRSPFWTADGLLRCQALVGKDGFELSPAGIAKVEKLIAGVDELKRGVALKRRIASRRDEALKDTWYWTMLNGSGLSFNLSMIMHHSADGMKAIKASVSQTRYILWMILNARKNDVWKKIIPYAVQVDEFAGMEVICFHSLDKKHFWRMQSKYYDLVTSRHGKVNWFFRGSGKSGLVARFPTARSQGLSKCMAAIVLPLDPDTTRNRPFPDPDINC